MGYFELLDGSRKKKLLDYQLDLKLNGKRLYQTSSVKYLGIKIDQYLNWQYHINNIAIKLNKANAMLSGNFNINYSCNF